MDRLFRGSGLFRSKWDQVHYADGKTYGQVTLEHAVGRTTEFYRAGGADIVRSSSSAAPPKGGAGSPVDGSVLPGDLIQVAQELNSSDPLGRTDLGNARRLVERHGQDLHFVFSWRHWLVWDGLSWKEDSSGEAPRRAKETALSIGQAALDLPDSRQREMLLAHARTSESVPRLEAMLASAASESGIPLAPDKLDADPFLLNVANGTLDLRSGTLRAPRREDLLSKTAPVAYQPEAEAPTWMTFLDRVTGGNLELCGFLQRIAGYCLSGDMRARCFFILYGRGANGKSTFLSTLLGMLGDYGQQGAAQTFIAIRGERVRNDLASLRGARLVATMETEEGQRLATALVKQITGGDRLRARFLFAEEFDFQPQCKLFFATNAKPEIRDLGPAMWERVRLIPFGVTIPQEERDPLLLEKLRAEWPGILAWAVRGCRLWLDEGGMLLPPGEVAEATEGYREEMDRLVPFLDDCCLLGPEKQVNSKDLYAAYRRWCEESGEKPISQIALTKNLVERHTEVTQIRGRGGRGLSGIGLTEEVLKELHVDAFDLSG
ncbi:MAG: phage/plasmid primase, P4 family, partial [bacterium]